jgi:hypothetical protein
VLALRLAAEKTVLPAFKRLLKPYAAPDRLDKTAFKVFENAFTSTFCFTLAIWAWHVTLFDNGGCTPFSTKVCLSTWPDVPLTRQFQLVWLSIGGYYTYEMIGTVLRVGCILNTDMVIHHVITMTMMLYGYFYSLSRYGLMATALLDTSNTLLHAAKALNYADIPQLERVKGVVSKGFALVFFFCRVLLPPFSLIKPGLLDGRRLPLSSYYITNGLLLFIYSLQLFWFHKILKIILGHENHEGEAPVISKVTAEVTTAAAPAGDKKQD